MIAGGLLYSRLLGCVQHPFHFPSQASLMLLDTRILDPDRQETSCFSFHSPSPHSSTLITIQVPLFIPAGLFARRSCPTLSSLHSHFLSKVVSPFANMYSRPSLCFLSIVLLLTHFCGAQDPQPQTPLGAACDPNRPCDESGCFGLNDFLSPGTGICTEGPCSGIACVSVCLPTVGLCADNDCQGIANATSSGTGQCTEGNLWGCTCNPLCSSSLTACSNCGGTNNPHGNGACGPGGSLGNGYGCPCDSQCPSNLACSNGQCNGASEPYPLTGGVCLSGTYEGCSCNSACGRTQGGCLQNGCNGISNPNGPGLCGVGALLGCQCTSTCGPDTGACNQNGCGGINDPHGGLGTCLTGNYAGCNCASVCPSAPNTCSSTGCAGFNDANGGLGVCQGGDYYGCQCESVCPQAPSAPTACNANGCAGMNDLSGGDGICTGGPLLGCDCISVCPLVEVACSTCDGQNGGYCVTGDFRGCACSTAANNGATFLNSATALVPPSSTTGA